ncbi:microtubule-associated protein 4 isoform 4-T5 [Discoglossus pictus]
MADHELNLSLEDALTDAPPNLEPEIKRDFISMIENEPYDDVVGETCDKTDYVPLLDDDTVDPKNKSTDGNPTESSQQSVMENGEHLVGENDSADPFGSQRDEDVLSDLMLLAPCETKNRLAFTEHFTPDQAPETTPEGCFSDFTESTDKNATDFLPQHTPVEPPNTEPAHGTAEEEWLTNAYINQEEAESQSGDTSEQTTDTLGDTPSDESIRYPPQVTQGDPSDIWQPTAEEQRALSPHQTSEPTRIAEETALGSSEGPASAVCDLAEMPGDAKAADSPYTAEMEHKGSAETQQSIPESLPFDGASGVQPVAQVETFQESGPLHPEDQATDVPSTEPEPSDSIADVPPSDSIADVPPSDSIADVPPSDSIADVPPSDSIADVPPSDSIADVPPSDSIADVPPSDSIADVPPSDSIADVPPSDSIADVPPSDSIADVPPSEPSESAADVAPAEPSESVADVAPAEPSESVADVAPAEPSESVADVAPAEPSESVADVAPAEPSESVADVAPAEPSESVADVAPAEPSESVADVAPAEPSESVADVAPAEPSESVADVAPAEPSESVADVAPAEPSESVADVAPAEPSESVADVAPAEPSESVADVAPAEPSESVADVAPAEPSESVADVAPAEPSESVADVAPAEPSESVADVAPAEPSESVADVAPSEPSESVADVAPAEPSESVADVLPTEETDEAESALAQHAQSPLGNADEKIDSEVVLKEGPIPTIEGMNVENTDPFGEIEKLKPAVEAFAGQPVSEVLQVEHVLSVTDVMDTEIKQSLGKEIQSEQPILGYEDMSNVKASPCKEIKSEEPALLFAEESKTDLPASTSNEILTFEESNGNLPSSPLGGVQADQQVSITEKISADLSASPKEIPFELVLLAEESKSELLASPSNEVLSEQPVLIAEESTAGPPTSPRRDIQTEHTVPLTEGSHTEELLPSPESLQKTPATTKQAYKTSDRKFGRTKATVVPVSDVTSELHVGRHNPKQSVADSDHAEDLASRAKALHKKAYEIMESRKDAPKETLDPEGGQAVMKKKKKKPKQKRSYPPKESELLIEDSIVNTKAQTEELKTITQKLDQPMEEPKSKSKESLSKGQLQKTEPGDVLDHHLATAEEHLPLPPVNVPIVEKGTEKVDGKDSVLPLPSQDKLQHVAQSLEGEKYQTNSTLIEFDTLPKETLKNKKTNSEDKPSQETKVAATAVDSKHGEERKKLIECPYLKQEFKLMEQSNDPPSDCSLGEENKSVCPSGFPSFTDGTKQNVKGLTSLAFNVDQPTKKWDNPKKDKKAVGSSISELDQFKPAEDLTEHVPPVESGLEYRNIPVEVLVNKGKTFKDDTFSSIFAGFSDQEFPAFSTQEPKSGLFDIGPIECPYLKHDFESIVFNDPPSGKAFSEQNKLVCPETYPLVLESTQGANERVKEKFHCVEIDSATSMAAKRDKPRKNKKTGVCSHVELSGPLEDFKTSHRRDIGSSELGWESKSFHEGSINKANSLSEHKLPTTSYKGLESVISNDPFTSKSSTEENIVSSGEFPLLKETTERGKEHVDFPNLDTDTVLPRPVKWDKPRKKDRRPGERSHTDITRPTESLKQEPSKSSTEHQKDVWPLESSECKLPTISYKGFESVISNDPLISKLNTEEETVVSSGILPLVDTTEGKKENVDFPSLDTDAVVLRAAKWDKPRKKDKRSGERSHIDITRPTESLKQEPSKSSTEHQKDVWPLESSECKLPTISYKGFESVISNDPLISKLNTEEETVVSSGILPLVDTTEGKKENVDFPSLDTDAVVLRAAKWDKPRKKDKRSGERSHIDITRPTESLKQEPSKSSTEHQKDVGPPESSECKLPAISYKGFESVISNDPLISELNTEEAKVVSSGILPVVDTTEGKKENVDFPSLDTDAVVLRAAKWDKPRKKDKRSGEGSHIDITRPIESLKQEQSKSTEHPKEVGSPKSILDSKNIPIEKIAGKEEISSNISPFTDLDKEVPAYTKQMPTHISMENKGKSKKDKAIVNASIAETIKPDFFEGLDINYVRSDNLVAFGVKEDKNEISSDVQLPSNIPIPTEQTVDVFSGEIKYCDAAVKSEKTKKDNDRRKKMSLPIPDPQLPSLELGMPKPEVKQSLKNEPLEPKSNLAEQAVKTECKTSTFDQPGPKLSQVEDKDFVGEILPSENKMKNKRGKAKASESVSKSVETAIPDKNTEALKSENIPETEVGFIYGNKKAGFPNKKGERGSLKRPHSSEKKQNIMAADIGKTLDKPKDRVKDELALKAPSLPEPQQITVVADQIKTIGSEIKHSERLDEKTDLQDFPADQAPDTKNILEHSSDILKQLNDDILILTTGISDISANDNVTQKTESSDTCGGIKKISKPKISANRELKVSKSGAEKDRADKISSFSEHTASVAVLDTVNNVKDSIKEKLKEVQSKALPERDVYGVQPDSKEVPSEPKEHFDNLFLADIPSPLDSSLNVQVSKSPIAPLETILDAPWKVFECSSLVSQSGLENVGDVPSALFASLVEEKVDSVRDLPSCDVIPIMENNQGIGSVQTLNKRENNLQHDMKPQSISSDIVPKTDLTFEVEILPEKSLIQTDLKGSGLQKSIKDGGIKMEETPTGPNQKKAQPQSEKLQPKSSTKSEIKTKAPEPLKGYMRPTKSRGMTVPPTRETDTDSVKPKQAKDIQLIKQRQDKVKQEAVEPTEVKENDITAPPSKELPPSPEKKTKALTSTPSNKSTAAKGKPLSTPNLKKPPSSTPTQAKKPASPAPTQTSTTTPKRPLGSAGRPSSLTPKDSKDAKPKSLDLKSPAKSPDKKATTPKQTPTTATPRSAVKASPVASKVNTLSTAAPTTGIAAPKPALTPKRPISAKSEVKPAEIKKTTKSPTELSRPKSVPVDSTKSNGTVPIGPGAAPSRQKTSRPAVPKAAAASSAPIEAKKLATTRSAPLSKPSTGPASKTTSAPVTKPTAPKPPRPASAPAPDLKNVRSKIGSTDNLKHQPGGGKAKVEKKTVPVSTARKPVLPAATKTTTTKPTDPKEAAQKQANGKVQIVSKKVNYSHVQSKCGSKDNIKHVPGGGNVTNAAKPSAVGARPPASSSNKPGKANVQILNKKIDVSKVSSKCGSKANIKPKTGSGDEKTENNGNDEPPKENVNDDNSGAKGDEVPSLQKDETVAPSEVRTEEMQENGVVETSPTLGSEQRESQSFNTLIPETSI